MKYTWVLILFFALFDLIAASQLLKHPADSDAARDYILTAHILIALAFMSMGDK